MVLDAIIIAGAEEGSVSSTHPMRLKIENRLASIQTIKDYITRKGEIQLPVKHDNEMSWSSAYKFNGIYLFSYLTQHGFRVHLLDDFYQEEEDFHRFLRNPPSSIIISTTFIYSKRMLKSLVDRIREAAPHVPIIAGGPFIYMSHQLLLKKAQHSSYETESAAEDYMFLSNRDEPEVDYYITSLKGEGYLRELLNVMKNSAQVNRIPCLAMYKEGEYRFHEYEETPDASGTFELDWERLPETIYKPGVVPVQASYGCPFHCAFCNFSKDRRLFYNKALDQLCAELRTIANKGVRYVRFVDDNFRLGGADLKLLCRRFIDEKVSVQWMCYIRASILAEIDPHLLKRAGCCEVQLGIESADRSVLSNMNKQSDPEMYYKVVRKLLASGINCSCYFIFGFPGETPESIDRTIDFINNIEKPGDEGTFSWSIYPFYLAPLSPIYTPEMRKKYQLTGYLHTWSHFSMRSKELSSHIKRAFKQITDTGPIYREDNMRLLGALSAPQRKKFLAKRQEMAKYAMQHAVDFETIRNAFSEFVRPLTDSV
jgi:p-methyltransferase